MDMNIKETLKKLFPGLNNLNFEITSPFDPNYNCIAWAAQDISCWWEPDPMGIYYWPHDVPREYTLDAYKSVFQKLGFDVYEEIPKEEEHIKVAIFSKKGMPTHATRQLESRRWTSKLGKSVDIEHELNGIIGDLYGEVSVMLKMNK